MKYPCDECGKNEATVHYTQVAKDHEVKEVHLCQECAERQSNKASVQVSLAELLSGLKDLETRSQVGKVCPQCGLSFSNFRKTGKLGCAACYDQFSAELEPIITRMHGSTSHSGKGTAAFSERRNAFERLARCKKELMDAIEREAYEEAARLRDAIRDLEVSVSVSNVESEKRDVV